MLGVGLSTVRNTMGIPLVMPPLMPPFLFVAVAILPSRIVPRAAVVQNSLTAFGLLDLLTVRYGTLAQKHGFPKV